MALFTVRSGNLQDLVDRLAVAHGTWTAALEYGIQQTADETISILSAATPVDKAEDNGVIPGEEGHLADSYVADAIEVGDYNASTNVRTTEPIKFGYVTQGTNPDALIYPVVKAGLWWPELAHPVASVHGQASDDFVTPTIDTVVEAGKVLLETVVEQWKGTI